MKYQIILADPPWSYNYNKSDTGSQAAGKGCANTQYQLIDNNDIAEMPIQDIADPNGCILFLWSSGALLKDCLAVMEGWGFDYVTMAVWTKHCRNNLNKDRLGVGYWFRSNAEPILVGRSGKRPVARRTNHSNHLCDFPEPTQLELGHIRTEQLGHSRKPDLLQDIIDETWPDLTKAELFARRNRPNWDSWGNQCPTSSDALVEAFGGTQWTPPRLIDKLLREVA